MAQKTTRLLPLGDSAWTVEFGTTIDATTNAHVMALAEQVALARQREPMFAAVTDVVPTFRSLTVHVAPWSTQSDALGQRLLALASCSSKTSNAGRAWRLPICFDPSFAPDLARLAQAKTISTDKVIELVLRADFRVYMIGFLPGFPYMGGLPPELDMPRLASPRQKVPANSLAVTGQMCAVYPWESPGGWNLLGRTPITLFDLTHKHQPAMLSAGDRVRWTAVTVAEYHELLDLSQTGRLIRESFLDEASTPCAD